VTSGVNLNPNLLPVEATLLSVNKDRFHGNAQGVIGILFGRGKGEFSGIAPLHSVPLKTVSAGGATVHLDPETHGYAVNPMMVPLFKDLSDALAKICVPIRNALKQYVSVDSSLLTGLKGEIEFYLGGLGMVERLQKAGLPVCRPAIAPMEERVSEIRQSYNVNLALKMIADGNPADPAGAIVKNDVCFNGQGRIIILTGPNRGGKTTYTQGIAIAQLLFQAGLPVPGQSARISPAEGIFTHFPIEEKVDGGTGRLGDEAKRFHEIFSAVTPCSLLVLNESFASTSPGEGFHIALDIVRILQQVGARTIFATHLHELAAKAAELNAAPDGNAVMSMVALTREEAGDGKPGGKRAIPEFRIVAGPPTGKSHAREIALKYGIDYGNLEALLRTRGLIGGERTATGRRS
jgi:DNA mismatch repair protein MutS